MILRIRFVYRVRRGMIFAAGFPSAKFGWHSPLRIVGWGRYDADFVPPPGEPFSHFSSVFAHSNGFRSEVYSLYQDPHALPLVPIAREQSPRPNLFPSHSIR